MAVAALGALIHDLILTAGVYSIVGFQVSPSTVVGLLTILGFSLYDTVVVFDKVDENSRGMLAATRYTYAEAANMAVNQTLMRSINTSIIGLLPVAGLLFVGAGILGVGTLEDLALVLFVGMLTGAYSSLFLATPWLVDLKMLRPALQATTRSGSSLAVRRRRPRPSGEARRGRVRGGAGRVRRPRPTAGRVAAKDEAFASTAAPRVGAKPARAGAAASAPALARPQSARAAARWQAPRLRSRTARPPGRAARPARLADVSSLSTVGRSLTQEIHGPRTRPFRTDRQEHRRGARFPEAGHRSSRT